MFCFNNSIAKKYNDLIKGQTFSIGSFKNNMIPIKALNYQNKDSLVFISQYRSFNITNEILFFNGTKPIKVQDFYNPEIRLLPLLFEYCKNNKMDLIICGSSQDDYVQEVQFYNKYIGSSMWVYKPRISGVSSYELIDNSSNIVSVDSTLGLEALVRRKRVAFFSARSERIGNQSYNFGWPNNLNHSGMFWTNQINSEEVTRILNFTIHVDDLKWGKEINTVLDTVLFHDPGNSVFKKVINSVLEK
jgi:surface carbohydrate biosynthesis protein